MRRTSISCTATINLGFKLVLDKEIYIFLLIRIMLIIIYTRLIILNEGIMILLYKSVIIITESIIVQQDKFLNVNTGSIIFLVNKCIILMAITIFSIYMNKNE